jgi:fucose 4-O-acetylase-like acetyltransferase
MRALGAGQDGMTGRSRSFNETIDLNERLYGDFLVCTVQALTGIYLALVFSSVFANYLPAARLFEYIGSGTLFILIFHSFVQAKVFGLMTRLFAAPLLAVLTSLVAGVVLPLMLWELVKKSAFLSALLLPKAASAKRSAGNSVG